MANIIANGVIKCRNLLYNINSIRLCSTHQRMKGLVLGAYTNKNESEKNVKLTPSAEKFSCSNNVSEKILKQINLGKAIKKGSVRLLWDIEKDYECIAIVGLGEEKRDINHLEDLDEKKEIIREAAGAGCKSLKDVGINSIEIEDLGDAEAAAEGATLGTWIFQEYKEKSKQEAIPHIAPLCPSEEFNCGIINANAQNFSRLLMNTPANFMTPTIFAKTLQTELSKYNVQVNMYDYEWIQQQKMGAFLSVTHGSIEPPVFVELSYNGTETDSKPYVLVGKGVTFDSGGISLKPSKNMDAMKADMGGGACVAATILGVARKKLPVHVKGLIPLCENLPSGSATKPGDVVIAKNGKSICVDNTDAEGRLILADALCYSETLNPSWVLDIATLTGAMVVAIGNAATGVFTNSDRLWEQLRAAGTVSGDRVWRFPLWKKYTKDMTTVSTAYDINNVSAKGGGGACTAAGFLREFVPKNVDWAHLDMAGVMDSSDMKYLGKGMTGRPTRTLIKFIEHQLE